MLPRRAAILGLVLGAGCSFAPAVASHASPADAPAPGRITVALDATATGGCCRVTTVNPAEELTVGCFVVVFDASERYVTTVLLPPKPPGDTRSSGFVAPAGRGDQGEFEIPLDLETGSSCRPAAWHGGAPI